MPLAYRRWLLTFSLTLALLIGVALWLTLRLPSFRDPPFDFYSMTPRELFMVDGLTRRQEGSVKLGFAETYASPQIGLYANHVFMLFGSEAFGRPGDNKYFFNYWFANLGLPEIYRYLRHIEALDRLPKKLILVQITSPNLDNGRFILDFGNELPPDLLLADGADATAMEKLTRLGAFAWEIAENWLHEVLNYNTFILGALNRGASDRVVDPAACPNAAAPPPPSGLPQRVAQALDDIVTRAGLSDDYCRDGDWTAAIRSDGSRDAQYMRAHLVVNEDPLAATERGIRAGDEDEIARLMRAIDAVGRRHGIKVVFVLPPAFETNRDDSVVNQVFDRALALVRDLRVIDDRSRHDDPSLFLEYVHPSPKYFRLLVEELRQRGLLPDD